MSTLPCETWITYLARSTIELLEKNSEFTLTLASIFARFQFSVLQRVRWACWKRNCTKQHPPLIWTNWSSDWERSGLSRSRRLCGNHSSVASSIVPDQWCVLRIPSLAIFPTWCYQLDSNLANLEATVKVGINSGVSFCNNSKLARVQ